MGDVLTAYVFSVSNSRTGYCYIVLSMPFGHTVNLHLSPDPGKL